MGNLFSSGDPSYKTIEYKDFEYDSLDLTQLQLRNKIKIAEWTRKVNYALEQEEVILESTLYVHLIPWHYFILHIKKTIDSNITFDYLIEFKFQDLLTCTNLDSIEHYIRLGHDEIFIPNIYAKYICYLIHEYNLKSCSKDKIHYNFPIVDILKLYLPNDLLYIIQSYILADDYVLKDNDIVGKDIDLNNWSLITGTENIRSKSSSYKMRMQTALQKRKVYTKFENGGTAYHRENVLN